MRSHLKVKVFTLAAEMTYIRRQELKWKERAKYARARQKALLAVAENQKAVSSQAYAENNFWSHRNHRYDLKEHARTSHLAYGCMRGVPYSQMEIMCYGPLKGFGSSEPDWKSVEDTIERFSKDETAPQDFMQSYAQWLEAAKIWYEGNTKRIEAWQKQRTLVQQTRLADPAYQRMIIAYKDEMKQRYQKKN